MTQRSGCSMADWRCRRRRCRLPSHDLSVTGGPSSPSPTTSTCSPMPTGSYACRQLPAAARGGSGAAASCSGVGRLLVAGERSRSCWSNRLVSKKNLADWLRDEFFKQHCALFGNRPFVWHIWDGQRDGFSALVNYHRLDRKTLEKLTYTYLGQELGGAPTGGGPRRRRRVPRRGWRPRWVCGRGSRRSSTVRHRWTSTSGGRMASRSSPSGGSPTCTTASASTSARCGGGRAPVAVRHPLAQGPWQEPRRHRAAPTTSTSRWPRRSKHGRGSAGHERDRPRSGCRVPPCSPRRV